MGLSLIHPCEFQTKKKFSFKLSTLDFHVKFVSLWWHWIIIWSRLHDKNRVPEVDLEKSLKLRFVTGLSSNLYALQKFVVS